VSEESAPSMPSVLVVDDELSIRRFLRAALEAEGYRVVEAGSLREGLAQATSAPPELLLVDLGLPDGDGLELIRRVREWTATPILVLSARGREGDKVAGLDAGADDYLTKPFGVGELLARLRVALRHRARLAAVGPDKSTYTVGELALDLARRRVTLAGQPVALTPIEYRLLATLAQAPGRVFTHRALLHELWGPRRNEAHLVRVHMSNLRRKLEGDAVQPRYLLTEPGVGYRLADE
jgi:two-component system KDP operon response regulator KdpE